jgi:dTDP-4-amino-4,6-dideoxygalactose transaminase
MINVTKTFLPPIEEYNAVLKQSWDKSWITNNGPLVQQLEKELAQFLGVKNILFCSNGTIVLQMALRAMNITGEVITTPFSYVATTNSILWENCKPVFVDIEPKSFCIDANKIEAAITERTQAIMATHVYGYPCDIEKIGEIARKHKLKVIYDAAHAFGSEYNGKQLLSYGDVSTCSFHATKIFHTVEGGCVITNDDNLHEQLKLYRSFGHVGDEYFSIGVNGKNSEFHAAMGICNLRHFPGIKDARQRISQWYDEYLSELPITRPSTSEGGKYNYAYYPVVLPTEKILHEVMEALRQKEVNTRRYFYPSLNTLPYLKNADSCPVSEDIAPRVLCLPLYHDLARNDVERISAIIKKQFAPTLSEQRSS